jgi:hypothetical protein
MSREFDSNAQSARSSDFSRCYFVRLVVPNWTAAPFTDGVLRFNTSALDFDVNGPDDSSTKKYYGGEGILTIAAIKESTELKRNGLQIAFSGLNNELLNLFLTSSYDVNRTQAFVYDAAMNPSGAIEHANINLVRIHKGLIDSVKYNTSSSSTTITIKTVSQFSDWSRPRVNALNNASQKDRDSTDRSLEFLADGVGTIKQVTWGNGK